MTIQACNVDKVQAELIWRGLWKEIDQIEADLDNRSITENVAFNDYYSAAAMLRQLNLRFHIVKDSTFEDMIAESALRERKWSTPHPKGWEFAG
jgi:hypothetical protein